MLVSASTGRARFWNGWFGRIDHLTIVRCNKVVAEPLDRSCPLGAHLVSLDAATYLPFGTLRPFDPAGQA